MKGGIREVAARAGVSVGTVSNVLNQPERVSSRTRMRVENAIRELGFVRNDAARTLRSGSRTVAMLVSDDSNPFFTDMARGARKVADQFGAVLALYSSDGDAARESRYLQVIEEQRVIGLLFDGFSSDLSQIRRRGTPAISLDLGANDSDQCAVSLDHRAGGRLVAEHLHHLGHREFAFIGGTIRMPQLIDRHEGFQEELVRVGARAPYVFWMGDVSESAGRAVAAELTRTGPGVTAVFCANDQLAVTLIQALGEAGIRVPDDISVVGYDDIAIAGSPIFSLTTVRQPREELGAAAARLLFDETSGDGEHVHEQIVMAPELVVRASTARVRGARTHA